MKPVGKAQGKGIFLFTKLSQISEWKKDHRWKTENPQVHYDPYYIIWCDILEYGFHTELFNTCGTLLWMPLDRLKITLFRSTLIILTWSGARSLTCGFMSL